LDRKSQLPTLIASKHGGMDIEEVAEKHPESMVIHHLDPFSVKKIIFDFLLLERYF